jgi:putative DNA primase/helicase
LCRLATGGGFGARKLYSDQDETILNVKRPIVINGIGNLANRSDLLDRALIVKLNPIPPGTRKLEKEFWAEFEQEKACIFTGLLDAVVCGLQNLEEVRINDLPRMADFTQWVTACEPALGLPQGSFLKVYNQNREHAHSIVIEGSILAEVIQEFCFDKVTDDNYKEIFLLKDFLTALKTKAGEPRCSDKGFPKNSRALRSGIERINPNLREIGIFITFLGKTGSNARNGASLSIEYICKQTSQPSQEDGKDYLNHNLSETCSPNGLSDGVGDVAFQATVKATGTSPHLKPDLSISCDIRDVGDVTKQAFSSVAE